MIIKFCAEILDISVTEIECQCVPSHTGLMYNFIAYNIRINEHSKFLHVPASVEVPC